MGYNNFDKIHRVLKEWYSDDQIKEIWKRIKAFDHEELEKRKLFKQIQDEQEESKNIKRKSKSKKSKSNKGSDVSETSALDKK
jgi:uncharacterized protein YwgA